MFRISADESIPHHHESVPMRPLALLAGSVLALSTIAVGLAMASLGHGLTAELAAPFVVIAGGLSLVAVVRCRRLELTVGTRRVDLRVGPFHRVVPTGAVERVESQSATGWRRLYGDHEIVLEVSIGSPRVRFPSRAPETMERSFAELRDRI